MNQPSIKMPLYRQVKQHILNLIASGDWAQGNRLPSENELVNELNVSRMTVNRALRELSDERYIERIAGVGSFVCEGRALSHPLEIRNIAEEIKIRGHQHNCKVIKQIAMVASAELAILFEITSGSRLFHSVILHTESGVPIQMEERFIHPKFAPDYLEVDFTQTNTTEYLLGIENQLDELEQIIRAQLPDQSTQELLQMQNDEPCLILQRRTWVAGQVVTRSLLFHPASRFEFGGRYKP
ncbi:MAG: histidine utilization repressor [Spongiibacteraceae bacterium]|nr:histidine utilization repressor [Spongiibacteraceae bacterium]